MNRVGILARTSTINEIFQTKILAWVSTLQSSTQHKNKLKESYWEKKIEIENVVMKMKLKMKSKLNQTIGMSVSIAVVNTVQK